MNPDTRTEEQRLADELDDERMDQELDALRAQETEADRKLVEDDLRSRYADITDDKVARLIPLMLDKQRLRKLANRERARLEVLRWQQSLLFPDENGTPMQLAIPLDAIRESGMSFSE